MLLIHLTLAPGVSVRSTPGGVSLGDSDIAATPEIASALSSISERPQSVDQMEQKLLAEAGPAGLAEWLALLPRLEAGGLVRYEVDHGERLIARFKPGRAGFERCDPGGAPLRLSRFAFVRRQGDLLVLDSPLAPGALELHDRAALALVAALGCPRSAADIAAELPQPWIPELLSLAFGAGLVVTVADDGSAAEDRERDHALWEFPDLLLHRSFRSTRRDRRMAPTYPGRDRFEPLPAERPRRSGTVLELPPPVAPNVRFADVLERRRSVRLHDGAPLTLTQLSSFLWLAAGARAERRHEFSTAPYEIIPRIHPAGGAAYPLEIYPVVGRCDGLASGVYRYDPVAHALESVTDSARDTNDLLGTVAWVMEGEQPPDVLLAITARFGRLAWKYEGLAYATVLRDVGVLYEAMYLVATALGLAPCAVGAGSSATVERILGVDGVSEGAVGEFLLGSAAR